MAKDPAEKTGRAALDERGNPTWEWRVDTGTYSRTIDTQRLKQIQEEAGRALQEGPAQAPEGFDPYSTIPSSTAPKPTRRTLDDMRKLSEEIKRGKSTKE